MAPVVACDGWGQRAPLPAAFSDNAIGVLVAKTGLLRPHPAAMGVPQTLSGVALRTIVDAFRQRFPH
jgi:hypothetical protein